MSESKDYKEIDAEDFDFNNDEDSGGDTDIKELPEEEILRLSEELDSKTRECEELQTKYLRAYADLENYKKRCDREKADYLAYANESLVSELLPVIDNFERALAHTQGENSASIADGVKLIIDQLLAVLKKFGLEEVKAEGERFNPELHHAISHDESAEAEPNTVVEVFQKGYFLKGKLVRPAMVSVSKD